MSGWILDANNDEKWMTRALALAEQAALKDEVPVGAVVVSAQNELLGEGYNQPISTADPTAHAELVALRAAARHCDNYRLTGSTLYVTIEPCAMCSGAIVHARVDRVVFAATEPKAGAVCSHLQLLDQPHLNHRVQWQGGVLAAQATAVMQGFFSRRRNEKKQAKVQRDGPR